MTATASSILNEARKYIGVAGGSNSHHKIIDTYNSVKPLPAGYKMTYNDNWCDTFVSFIGIEVGATGLIGRECSVQRHIEIFKKLRIWNEDGTITPKPGDIICYNWDDATQENDGWADHIGFVETVQNGSITLIEGNYGNAVKRRTIPVGWGYIRGYARPKYGSSQKPSTPSKPEKPSKPSTPSKPKENPWGTVAEDSQWGEGLTIALQKYYGSGTIDGEISGQIKSASNRNVYAAVWGSGGSNLIRVFQMRLRDKGWYKGAIDGNLGPDTVKGLQKAFKTTQDGIISAKSQVVLAMQKALNKNKMPF